MERLQHRDDQLDESGRGEELAAFRALGLGELTEKIFVNLAEDVALDVERNRGKEPQQRQRTARVSPWRV